MSGFASSSSLHVSQHVDVPSGFKFKPSPEQLINNYLIPKIEGTNTENNSSTWFNIKESHVYEIEPWKLNLEPKPYLEENEGYYFVKTKMLPNGKRIRGESLQKRYHWKNKNGKLICDGKALETSLSFKAQKGSLKEFQKGWAIREFGLRGNNVESDWVLCRVFKNEKKKSTSSKKKKKEKKKSTIPKIRQPNEIPEIHQFFEIFKMLNENPEINQFLDTDDQVHFSRFAEITVAIGRGLIADSTPIMPYI